MPRSKSPGSAQGQGNGSTNKASLSNTEAVRQALAELGQDARAIKIQGYLKDRLDIEMTTKQITDARSQILRKAAKQGKPTEAITRPQEGGMASSGITKQSRTAEEPAAPLQQSGPAPASKEQGGIPLPDILTIKDLVERLGAGPLHTLIDAFAR